MFACHKSFYKFFRLAFFAAFLLLLISVVDALSLAGLKTDWLFAILALTLLGLVILSAIVMHMKRLRLGLTQALAAAEDQVKTARAAKEQMIMAAQAGRVALWEWDVRNDVLTWAPFVGTLLSFSDDDLPRNMREWDALIHPEDRVRVIEARRRHFSVAEAYDIEYRVQNGAGNYLWWQDSGLAVFDEKGDVLKMLGTGLDISSRKRIQDAFEQRVVALTRPVSSQEGFSFDDLFNVADIQTLQDSFADATGVASIITKPDGTPITRPRNFCRLCRDVLRCHDSGMGHCRYFNLMTSESHSEGFVIKTCLFGAFWDAEASITLEGRHVANWLMGQVRNKDFSEEILRSHLGQMGLDEEVFWDAFREVPVMSREQFTRVAHMGFEVARQLSLLAHQNVQQARLIAERETAQERVRASEERLRVIFEQTFQMTGLLTPDGKLLEANKTALDFAGVRRDEVMGKMCWDTPWWHHSAEEQQRLKSLIAMAASGISQRMQTTSAAAEGGVRSIDFSIKPVIDERTGAVTLLIVEGRDITSIVQAQEELTRHHEMLKEEVAREHRRMEALQMQLIQTEKMASLTQLAAGVAHEINNPIGAVLNNLHVLRDDVDDIRTFLSLHKKLEYAAAQGAEVKTVLAEIADAEVQLDISDFILNMDEVIAETNQGAERVRRIVKDLRVFARSDQEVVFLEDVNTLIRDVVETIPKEQRYRKDVLLKLAPLPKVACYPQHFKLAMYHLVLNALQAVAVYGRVEVRSLRCDNYVQIDVEDNGCGILEENLCRVFEPFFTTREVGEGAGLGLSVVYGIVQSHEGTISVKSNVGIGSVFSIRMPLLSLGTADSVHS